MITFRSFILLGMTSVIVCQPYFSLLSGTFPSTSSMGAAISRPNGHIYLLGGEDILAGNIFTNATWFYADPLGSPVLKAPLTSPRTQGCAVLVDDKYIFYIGGKISTTSATGQILRYNISGDSWEVMSGATLTKPRFLPVCVFDSSTREILILFGTDTSGSGDSNSYIVEKYHVDSNFLSTITYPGQMPNHGSAANGVYDPATNLTYIIGGNANADSITILSQSLGWINTTTIPGNPLVSYSSVTLVNNQIWVFKGIPLLVYSINNGTWVEGSISTVLDYSGSNLAPISGPNIHIFAKDNYIVACALPCPAPSSPCQVNECDYGTGRCVTSPVDNGKSCGNADGCTGSNCVCTDGQCLSDVLNADIQPYFECFAETGRFDTAYTAYISWNNRASSSVAVQKGSSRNLFTGLVPQNQPDVFLPDSYPLNDFQLEWNGTQIAWRLTDYDLTIDAITPSLICPTNITVYVTVRGDTLTIEDLPVIIARLARLFGITQSRVKLNFYTGTKRQSDQTLELEIQEALPQTSEPSSQQVVVDLVNSVESNSTDPDVAVSVNGKKVEVISVSTKPPSNARPGVAAPVAVPMTNASPSSVDQPSPISKTPNIVVSSSSLLRSSIEMATISLALFCIF